ncbi:MAG: PD-(D/E)XK nuclease family transposase [Leptospiraceae bacterium]|nr:PD-(D/E)XK nuclease family transposase [Leptospiraceae bacterium]MCP5513804.1 PD-(D/E)XK nuclease family transposase [Leptospiraceae bacterium]
MQERVPKYINPYTDFGFKKLFGEEGNKDLLIDFLNQILPEKHQIRELSFRNPESLADLPFLRKAIFDIYCKGANGEDFIVEMQKEKLEFFKDRSLFAVSFPIQEQAKRGNWNFKLQHIYLIAILDFQYDEKEERKKFERYVQLKDQDGDVFYEKLHFHFLQMPLFKKTESELTNRFEKWCYFLKNLETFDTIPTILKEPIFEKAFRTSEIGAMNQAEYDVYKESLLSYWESLGMIDTARKEGKLEGKLEEKLEIAQKCIAKGMSDEETSELTGLSLDEVRKIS